MQMLYKMHYDYMFFILKYKLVKIKKNNQTLLIISMFIIFKNKKPFILAWLLSSC